MEWLFLGGFCALLTASLALDFFILWALLGGYLLFFSYGLLKGHRPKALLAMSWEGLRTVKTILFLFLLIGMITALWRASGTIAVIVCYAARFIQPSVFLLMSRMEMILGEKEAQNGAFLLLCLPGALFLFLPGGAPLILLTLSVVFYFVGKNFPACRLRIPEGAYSWLIGISGIFSAAVVFGAVMGLWS